MCSPFVSRLIHTFSKVFRHLFMALFTWSFVSISGSMLMFAMELVELASTPFESENSLSIHVLLSVTHKTRCSNSTYCTVLRMVRIWLVIFSLWAGTTDKQCVRRNRRFNGSIPVVLISGWCETNFANDFDQFSRIRRIAMLWQFLVLSGSFQKGKNESKLMNLNGFEISLNLTKT